MTAVPERHPDAAAARRFARKWLQVELASVLSTNFLRPATGLIICPAVIFTIMVTTTLRLVLPSAAAALVVAVPIGCAIATTLYSWSACWTERRGFATASHRWLLPIGDGWAGAYAKPDRQGRMTLYSVWASPRGQHLGSVLMRQICTEMDDACIDLQLVAVNGAVASFYRNFGFQLTGEGRFGHGMLRPCTHRSADVD